MATISKLPTGKFKAIIRRNGRARCKTFARKGDARIWIKRKEADQDSLDAMGLPGAALTLAELVDRYMAQWSGRDQAIHFKVKYWRDVLGEHPLLDIDRQMIRVALDEYAAGVALRGNGRYKNGRPRLKHAGRKRSPATVNRMKSTISAIFKYAIGKDLVRKNPACGIPCRTENNKRVRYLSDGERVALLAASEGSTWPKLHLLIVLALTTGARQGELLGLRWSDIDFQKRLAFLATTKNGEPRVLPLPSPAMAALEPWREVGNGLVFPSETRPGQPFEFRKHWLKALQEAEIENFRFHDLRHSAASYLVMNGATLNETAEVLGHKRP